MYVTILALFLALFGSSRSGASIGDCSSDLTRYSYAKLVERALERSAISLEDAERLAASDRPTNPLAGAVLDSSNSSLFRVFENYSAIPENAWKEEREKIREILAARGRSGEAEGQARRATKDFFRFQLAGEAGIESPSNVEDPDRVGILRFQDASRKNYFAFFFEDRLEVHDIHMNLLWRDSGDDGAVYAMEFRQNAVGIIEFRILHKRTSRLRRFFGPPEKEKYLLRTVNLSSKVENRETVHLRAVRDLFLPAPAKTDSASTFNGGTYVWVKESERALTIRSAAGAKMEHAALTRLRDGRVFVAVASSTGRESLLEIFEPLRDPHRPVREYRDVGSLVKGHLSWYEKNGEMILVLDSTYGTARFFSPFSDMNRPFATEDVDMWARSPFTAVAEGDEIFLVSLFQGESPKLKVFSLYQKPK